jgi:NADPH:quinone reductase-like Zn-dependent oxidoreductase
MKAVVYSEYGGPEVLRHVDIGMPTPADEEILVRVHAAAVNPLDWHFMRGTPLPMRMATGFSKPEPNRRLGAEYAGTIEAVGRHVTQFAVGEAVFGGREGALAEYLTVRADRAVRKPGRLTFEQAAGICVAGMTALNALRDKAQVQPGQKVLINGASGGVGTFAVQIAKVLGAEVTGVQSTRNMELVRSLGADHVIDYTKDDFTAGHDRYDVVLDNVGNRALSEIRRVMTPRGTYLPNGGGSPHKPMSVVRLLGRLALVPFVSQTIKLFVATPNREDLQTLGDLIESGRVTPVIDRCYPLSEAADAMRYLESGRARGKVVVTIA